MRLPFRGFPYRVSIFAHTAKSDRRTSFRRVTRAVWRGDFISSSIRAGLIKYQPPANERPPILPMGHRCNLQDQSHAAGTPVLTSEQQRMPGRQTQPDVCAHAWMGRQCERLSRGHSFAVLIIHSRTHPSITGSTRKDVGVDERGSGAAVGFDQAIEAKTQS